MQYVNDDMDELFRRAAENYPLDTGSGDWSKVAKALQDPEENKSPQNGKSRFLWLLLLLPLALICNPFSRNDRGVNHSETATHQKQESFTGKAADNKKQLQSAPEVYENIKHNPEKLNSATGDVIIKSKSIISDMSINASGSGKLKQDNSNFKIKNSKRPSQTITGTIPAIGVETNSGSSIAMQTKEGSEDFEYLISNRVSIIGSYILNQNKASHFDPSPHQDIVKDFSVPKSPIQKPEKRFYAGLMGGIDATTIRFQKWEQPGFNYGVLAGYSFNKRWSVETGVYREKKFYYTKARYFNTSKIYMAPNSSISEVSGNCTMFEIPISVKFDFASGRKSGWFSTLGISSYVMNKEDYTYQYYYGSSGPVPHRKVYSNTTTQLFSSLRLSGGYQHELGRIGSLRIEPYFSLPVSGMGFGKVKMISTGMHVGIVKKLW